MKNDHNVGDDHHIAIWWGRKGRMVSLMALRMLMIIMTDETKSVWFKRVSRKRWQWHLTPLLLQCFVCRKAIWLIRTKHLREGLFVLFFRHCSSGTAMPNRSGSRRFERLTADSGPRKLIAKRGEKGLLWQQMSTFNNLNYSRAS